MKKNALAITLLIIVCMAAAPVAEAAQAAVTRINVSTSFNLGHPVMRRVLAPWADEVKRRTSGRVDIRFFNPEVLLEEREHFNAVRKGDLGGGHGLVSASQGRLLVTGIMDMPSGMTDCMAASEAFWLLYAASPEIQEEFKGIKVLAMHASAPYQINMTKDTAGTLTELKNQKILTPLGGDSARLLRVLGINPLMTPERDFSSSLARNMADGCFMPVAALRAAMLEDKIASITMCDLRMDAYWMGINMDAYNTLPPDAQKILGELSGLELSLAIAGVLGDLDSLGKAEIAKEKIIVTTISQEERAAWLEQAVPPMRDNWIAQLKRRQINNGEEIWDRAQGIFNETQAKWHEQARRQATASN